MLRIPSTVFPTGIVWSQDPALIDHDANDEEWKRKLAIARETGDYAPVTKQGERLAFFHVKPIRPSIMRKLSHMLNDDTPMVFWSTVFRLAIDSIENVEGLPKIERVNDSHLGSIATEAIVDALDLISPSLVNEIAVAAFERSSAPFRG